MKCTFKPTDQPNHYICDRCGFTLKSPNGPEKIHMTCRTNESQGLGDTISKITGFFGISGCGGCSKRQEKLNKLFPYKNKKTQDTK